MLRYRQVRYYVKDYSDHLLRESYLPQTERASIAR